MRLKPKRSQWKDNGTKITKFKNIRTDKNSWPWNKWINTLSTTDHRIFDSTIVKHFYTLKKSNKESLKSSSKIIDLFSWKNNRNTCKEKNGKIGANLKLLIEIKVEIKWTNMLMREEFRTGLIMLLKLTNRRSCLKKKRHI